MENSLKVNATKICIKEQNCSPSPQPKADVRIKSDDYKSWDKLNVDQELEKIDFSEIKIKESKLSELPSVDSKLNIDISKSLNGKSKGEIEVLADLEKFKGNECFKAGGVLFLFL